MRMQGVEGIHPIVSGAARVAVRRNAGRPGDRAGLLRVLPSEDADYIPGRTISVSGGLTMQ